MEALPDELFRDVIGRYLSARDRHSLQQSCKRFRKFQFSECRGRHSALFTHPVLKVLTYETHMGAVTRLLSVSVSDFVGGDSRLLHWLSRDDVYDSIGLLTPLLASSLLFISQPRVMLLLLALVVLQFLFASSRRQQQLLHVCNAVSIPKKMSWQEKIATPTCMRISLYCTFLSIYLLPLAPSLIRGVVLTVVCGAEYILVKSKNSTYFDSGWQRIELSHLFRLSLSCTLLLEATKFWPNYMWATIAIAFAGVLFPGTKFSWVRRAKVSSRKWLLVRVVVLQFIWEVIYHGIEAHLILLGLVRLVVLSHAFL